VSNNHFPEFEQISLPDYEPVNGYYILGMLKQLRPDVTFVTPADWKDYQNYAWLDEIIQESLSNGKPVCILPWDEAVLAWPDSTLSTILNQYQKEPVWFVTQLDARDQMIYTDWYRLGCKIFDLPWLLLNDTLAYYHVSDRTPVAMPARPTHQYLCMLGRYESHKFDLALALRHRDLHLQGLITVSDPEKYPEENRQFCLPNANPPTDSVAETAIPGDRASAHYQHGDISISGNVKNYLFIEQTYADIPMIVHPDTTCGIFQNTEKVLWPLLLGRVMLTYGRPGVMSSIQKWYDVDFAEYANLEFDSYQGDWSHSAHAHRLDLMLDLNQDLIQNSAQVHRRLQPQLEAARWTIGKNLYKYFVANLDQIDKDR
jgi:hypothetical protein